MFFQPRHRRAPENTTSQPQGGPRGDTGGRARSSLAVGRSGDGSEPRLPPVGGHPSAFGGAVGAEMGASEV